MCIVRRRHWYSLIEDTMFMMSCLRPTVRKVTTARLYIVYTNARSLDMLHTRIVRQVASQGHYG